MEKGSINILTTSINAEVTINNLPTQIKPGAYMVARYHGFELWYYGQYETPERAKEVCQELQNAIYIKVGENNS